MDASADQLFNMTARIKNMFWLAEISNHKEEAYRCYTRCWWHLTLHIINVEKNVSRLLFRFFSSSLFVFAYRGFGRIEVVWVCFDVLFFISEFHFLFLLIFILFWLTCIYLCCWFFPLGVYSNVCLFAYLLSPASQAEWGI